MCLEYSCVADLCAAIGLPEAAMNRIALAGLGAALWGEKGVCPLLGTAQRG